MESNANTSSSPFHQRRRRLKKNVDTCNTYCRYEELHVSNNNGNNSVIDSHCRRRRQRWNNAPPFIFSSFIILASHLFNHAEAEVIASNSNSNLRRHQQEHQYHETKSSASSSTLAATYRQLAAADCIDKWHISLDDSTSCTNKRGVPPREAKRYDTSADCCRVVKRTEGKCNIIDECHGMVIYDGGSNYNYYGTTAACTKTTWHMSTEELNACTNSGEYPSDWNSPKKREEYIFTSAEECCEESYPNENCRVVNVCPTPPPTPQPTTRSPRTRKPRPTEKPTRSPTPPPTTPVPDWYVDRKISKCVMDCVDEPGRPCGETKNNWEPTFKTLEDCCESINWIPAEECYATASPVTSPPTSLLGEADMDGPMPTRHPTKKFDWYIERSTNQCVQDCEDEPGYPCGGPAGKWETRYKSVQECCNTQPWKPFDDCQATASPITPSPSTPPDLMMDATPKPTRPKRTPRPSKTPTRKPTIECPAPYWVLFKNGATTKCINDISYVDSLLNADMISYLLFDTAAECCASQLAGNNCHIVDVCSDYWFGDYSGGWENGVCVNSKDGNPIPKGRRTFNSQLECCLDAFLGQSSEACVSFLQ